MQRKKGPQDVADMAGKSTPHKTYGCLTNCLVLSSLIDKNALSFVVSPTANVFPHVLWQIITHSFALMLLIYVT